MPLSKRQLEFAQNYIIDFNGQRAAEAAGYSKGSARGQASRLLTNCNIQKKIKELIQARADRVKVTQDMVIQELCSIAFSHIGNVFFWDGLTFKVVENPNLRGVSALTFVEGSNGAAFKVRMRDKVKALYLLGLHLGLFDGSNLNREDNKQRVKSKLIDTLKRMRANEDI